MNIKDIFNSFVLPTLALSAAALTIAAIIIASVYYGFVIGTIVLFNQMDESTSTSTSTMSVETNANWPRPINPQETIDAAELQGGK